MAARTSRTPYCDEARAQTSRTVLVATPAAGDAPCDPVAQRRRAVLRQLEVEPPQHRPVVVDEHVERAVAGICSASRDAEAFVEMLEVVVPAVGDRRREPRAVGPLERQDGRRVVGPQALEPGTPEAIHPRGDQRAAPSAANHRRQLDHPITPASGGAAMQLRWKVVITIVFCVQPGPLPTDVDWSPAWKPGVSLFLLAGFLVLLWWRLPTVRREGTRVDSAG